MFNTELLEMFMEKYAIKLKPAVKVVMHARPEKLTPLDKTLAAHPAQMKSIDSTLERSDKTLASARTAIQDFGKSVAHRAGQPIMGDPVLSDMLKKVPLRKTGSLNIEMIKMALVEKVKALAGKAGNAIRSLFKGPVEKANLPKIKAKMGDKTVKAMPSPPPTSGHAYDKNSPVKWID